MLLRRCAALSRSRLIPCALHKSPLSRATVFLGSCSQQTYSTKARQVLVTSPPGFANAIDFPRFKDGPIHPGWLRDGCRCVECVDPSTQQKNFQTSDIPGNIKATSIAVDGDNISVTWENDLPGYGPNHVSTYSSAALARSAQPPGFPLYVKSPIVWDSKTLAKDLQFFDYADYLENPFTLYRALMQLDTHGILLVRNAPISELSVEKIANRIGNLMDTFYGRTWDVRSIPDAKNVAYTSKNLGLHMDLLYTADPPGLQFLHCLKNSCSGGLSVFSDTYRAVDELDSRTVQILRKLKLQYRYENDGQNFSQGRYVLGFDYDTGRIKFVNWSPPFQGPLEYMSQGYQEHKWPWISRSLREFASRIEAPENVFQYRLQEGDCVIFNNRRVLHGRTAFDTAGGERWLKGAYVAHEVFKSKSIELDKKYGNLTDSQLHESATYVNPRVRK